MSDIDVYEVVNKLVGPIRPIGETHTDDKHYDNLRAMTLLVEMLILDLVEMASKKDTGMYSVDRAQSYSRQFLVNHGVIREGDINHE